jgi:hypothetical protein
MFLVGAPELKPEESRDFRVLGFGYPSWQMTLSDLTLTRRDDTVLLLPDGKEATARHFTYRLQTPMGPFEGEAWTDEQGVVLKSRLKMPFGTVEAALE